MYNTDQIPDQHTENQLHQNHQQLIHESNVSSAQKQKQDSNSRTTSIPERALDRTGGTETANQENETSDSQPASQERAQDAKPATRGAFKVLKQRGGGFKFQTRFNSSSAHEEGLDADRADVD